MAKNPKTGLTDKQDDFCHQYIIDKNGDKAAIRAKYSPKTARFQASYLLTKPNIIARIAELQAKINEKNEISAEIVVKRFIDLADRANQKGDLVNENRALENLGKHTGIFERDNEQKRPQTNITLS